MEQLNENSDPAMLEMRVKELNSRATDQAYEEVMQARPQEPISIDVWDEDAEPTTDQAQPSDQADETLRQLQALAQ
jgi:hypothetical protein